MMKMARLVGNPIKADEATANRTRVGYAHIFVEIAAKKLLLTGEYELSSGQVYSQRMEYEWIPPTCSKCKCFGHPEKECKAMGQTTQETNMKEVDTNTTDKGAGDRLGEGQMERNADGLNLEGMEGMEVEGDNRVQALQEQRDKMQQHGEFEEGGLASSANDNT